jgi:hypothetical protein
MAKRLLGVGTFDGKLYAYDPVLNITYRSKERSGLGSLAEIDWEAIFSGFAPIIQGVGKRIAGQPQPIVPIQQYALPAQGSLGGITPTMLLLFGGVILVVMMMGRQ